MQKIKKAIIIDDDPMASALMSRHLRKNNEYTVSTFKNAEDALTSITAGFPDVLIIDFRLPGMSGIELFEKIKSKMPSSSVVIIASTMTDGNLVLKFIQKGVRNFLIKDKMVIGALDEILWEELRNNQEDN